MTPLIDRRPERLMKLNLIALTASTPEQMLGVYNSLVDAYNDLIDAHNRLLDEKIAELIATKRAGKWIYAHDLAGMRYYRCANCADAGVETLGAENEVTWWRFCPRCGAKMFTKEEEKPHDNFCKAHGCSLETRQSCCGCKDYFDNKQRMKKEEEE